MPLYTVSCRNPLSQEVREALSTAITHVHCEVTEAPPEWVNVVFLEGYFLKKGWDLAVIGGIRSGGNRSSELVTRLRDALYNNIASAAKLPIAKIGIELIGVQANWVMEGGKTLPEPGAEMSL